MRSILPPQILITDSAKDADDLHMFPLAYVGMIISGVLDDGTCWQKRDLLVEKKSINFGYRKPIGSVIRS
jgi:hypothetical protein